jgi:hypothetical protein
MNSNEKPVPPSERKIAVPRDRDPDTAASSRRSITPSPDTVNIRDEDYPSAETERPLPADSPVAAVLHEQPPHGRDQLQTGSAGDAARPSKTGVMRPTLPPRGQTK